MSDYNNIMEEYYKDYMQLKELVRDLLKETEYVTFRSVDCDQTTVYNLINQLRKAVSE